MSIVSRAVGEQDARAPAFAACLRNGTNREALVGEIRESLAELNRRSARLLMVELDDGPEGARLGGAVRDREHRLSAVIEVAGRVLERPGPASGDTSGELGQGGWDRVADDGELAELQAAIQALTAAVDAFVADPESDGSFSGLDQYLGEVESRLGCRPIERAPRPAGRWQARSPPPLDTTDEAAPAEPSAAARRDAPPPLGWGSPVGRAGDPGVGAELGVLGRRVRRLEGQLRLTFVLLALTAGLAAFGLWRLHGLEAGWLVRQAELERRPASPPRAERVLGGGQADPVMLPRNGAEGLVGADAGPWESGGTATGAGAAAVTEPAAADRSADEPESIRASPRVRDPRPDGPAPPEDALALPAASDDLASASELVDDGLAVVPSPTGADGPAAESSDALVLDLPSYAIQLIAFRDKERMLAYVEERGLADRALYGLSSSGGSRWYVVVQGFYPSRPAAQAAAEELPEALKRLEPWIKQFPAGSRFERFERTGGRARADASTGSP